MLVNVCYRAPVVAVVDTETKKIVRVVVDDDSISAIEYCETADSKSGLPACTALAEDHAEAVAAREIAEAPDADWPAWTFGF